MQLAVAKGKYRLLPRDIITPKSVENALRVLLAIGASTNAIVHLTAIAGRLGIPVPLDRLNVMSDELPLLVDLKPTDRKSTRLNSIPNCAPRMPSSDRQTHTLQHAIHTTP